MRHLLFSLLIFSAANALAADGLSVEATPPSSTTPVATTSSPGFDQKMEFADGLYARDMFDLALTEYDGILAQFSGDERAHEAIFRAAESLFFLERWDEAVARYREYVAKRPGTAEASAAEARIGEALYHLGKKSESRSHFSKLLGTAKGRAAETVRYYLGKIYFEEGNHASAEIYFEPIAADEKAAYASFANYYLGEIALAAGESQAASVYLEKAAASPETAAPAKFALGRAYFLGGRYAEAKTAFQDVWNAPAGSGLGEDAFLNFLNSLYNLDDFEAIVSWRTNLAAQLIDVSKLTRGKFLLAGSLVRLKRIDEAKAVYDEIAASSASETDKQKARIERIEAIVEGGDIEAALGEIESLIEHSKGSEGPLVLLMATLLKRVDRPLEAVRQIDRLIELGSDDGTISEAMVTKAYTLIEAGKPKRGRRALVEFVAKFAEDPLAEKAHYDIVLIDLQVKDKDRAVTDARAYLERYPEGEYAESVALRLASLYTDLQDPATARHVFVKYFERYPDSKKMDEAHFLAGYNEQTAGDAAKALEHYRLVRESGVPRETYISTLKNRGATSVTLGDDPAAARDYQELVSCFAEAPIDPAVFFWLIDHHLGRGNAASARSVLDIFASRPEAVSREGERSFYEAETLRLEKRYDEALIVYDKLIASNSPLAADAFLGRGLVAAALGQRDKARADYAEAMRRSGEDHEIAIRARREQAALYFDEESFAEAAKAYLAIAILYDDPRYAPEAMMRAAESFERAGDAANSQKIYAELTERFAQHPLAAEAGAKIKKEVPSA